MSAPTAADKTTLKDFSARLRSACDNSPHIPGMYQGRQTYVAGKIGVSQEAVRKWLAGESMPKRPKVEALAKLLDVDYAWLALGIKPETTPDVKRLAGKVVDASVMLVAGHMSLLGSTVSFPDDGSSVHLYAIIKGRMLTIHVCSFRETVGGVYELTIPGDYEKLTCVGFVNKGVLYKIFDLPRSLIEQHKSRRADDFTLNVEEVEGVYVVGDEELKEFDPLGGSSA